MKLGTTIAMLALFGALTTANAQSETSKDAATSQAAIEAMGEGFTSGMVDVGDTKIHYIRGGTGPAVLLIHGFPQDWSEYRGIMPALSKHFTVVAIDLPGIGGSTVKESGYNNASVGRDIDALVRALKLDDVYVVAHDLGGGIGYSYARQFPSSLRGLMILDVPIAGLEPWETVKTLPFVWHFAFHQLPDHFAETMITGQLVPYFKHFFTTGTVNHASISEADVQRFAAAYTAPSSLTAGMEYYRAFPKDEVFNAAQTGPCGFPVVLAAGDHSFAALLPPLAKDLKAHGCADVSIETIVDSAHYVTEDQPEQVIALIEKYAAAKN